MSLKHLLPYLRAVDRCRRCFVGGDYRIPKSPAPEYCLLKDKYPTKTVQLARDRGFVQFWEGAVSPMDVVCLSPSKAGRYFMRSLRGDFE